MSRVTLSQPLPLSTAIISKQYCQCDSNVSEADEILHLYSKPFKYSSFEENGIDLLNPGQIAAESNVIGAVTNEVGTFSGLFCRILLERAEEVTEAIVFNFEDAFTAGSLTVISRYLADPDDPSVYYDRESVIDIVGSKELSLNPYISTTYPYLSYVNLTFSNATVGTRKFIKLSNVTLGTPPDEINIIDQAEVHGEISLTLDDLPITTAELTVEIINGSIKKGSEVLVESNNFSQCFLIDDINRTAQNVYELKCSDQLSIASDWAVTPSDSKEAIAFHSISQLLGESDNCPIFFDRVLSASGITGYLSGGMTCRQALAMYQAAVLRSLCTFGTTVISHSGWALPIINGTSPEIKRLLESHDLLDRSSYSERERVGYVTHKIDTSVYDENLNVTTPYSWDLKEDAHGSHGSLKVYDFSHITLFEGTDISDTPATTISKIAEIVNADEVSATIEYEGEKPGDWVSIETAYDGVMLGVISEINLIIGFSKSIAEIKVKVIE